MPTTGSSHSEVNDENELDDVARRSLPDDDTLLWESLKAETGYTSYLAYLATNGMDRRAHHLIQNLTHVIRDTDSSYSCAVIDVEDEDRACWKLAQRCYSTSGTEVLSSLRQVSATTKLRIVLWESTTVTEDMLNAIGLGLKVQLQFLSSFVARHPRTSGQVADISLNTSDKVVVIGQYVMALIRDYLPGDPEATPIILIAAVDQERLRAYDQFFDTIAAQKLATQATNSTLNSLHRLPGWTKAYLHYLESDLNRARMGVKNDIDLTLSPLTALLQFYMPLVRLECRVVRAEYLQETKPGGKGTVGEVLQGGFKSRYMLRRMIEDSEDNSLRLRGYMQFIMRDDTPQSQWLLDLECDLQHLCLEASRLETEIRDYLQLQTAELALQESRKSIELSNFQIQEAKRVKIFTILAFVYVPLNLATSIFGMNIQQLNRSGQHLSVFITTAAITLAVTGGSLFVIEQFNSYRKWQKRTSDVHYNGRTQFPLLVRLAMLVSLVSNGHTRWMWRSGAWWRISMNQRSLLRSTFNQTDDNGRLTAGEYVSKYSTRDLFIPYHFSYTHIEWIDGAEED